MSRVAKNPIAIPKGVVVKIESGEVTVNGDRGSLRSGLHPSINIALESGSIRLNFDKAEKKHIALAGTLRANLANMVYGVSRGYERKLTMVGVGYRAQAKGKVLSLSLGYSHPVEFVAPDGITIDTPSQTEIVIKGCDKQQVGQVAANIRSYRSPEPYKGKGVRYSDEVIIRKEAKKK